MPLRLILAICCAGCFACLGFFSDAAMRRRCKGLDSCLEAVRLLEFQLLSQELPLQEAVENAADGNPFLSALCAEQDIGMESSWHSACQRLGLIREDAAALLGLKRAVARRERGERESFRLCREELTCLKQKAEKTREREGTIHKKLGVLLGAAALVLLC